MCHTFQKNDNDSFPNKEVFEHYLNLIALSRKWNNDLYSTILKKLNISFTVRNRAIVQPRSQANKHLKQLAKATDKK